uniref:Integrase, catalytic region, zinc finger, CCHC-type, peptidase aspartic, catalytic n=1 Tax=Tanacetum cinerariifolium TaxID=118510 RepID=A0A6L2KD59_TANCI|nr:hypothetical protein [Tanacetum cinerariifolium]
MGRQLGKMYSRWTLGGKIAVKLNRGLRDSNYDQLYAYLKQHGAHANENKIMLDRFTQHTVDPLALLSNVSHQHYYLQSSTTPPSTSVQPHFADSTQLDLGLSPTDNLIENLTNVLSLLTQSYKTYLPQTNNQLRTSSNTKNQATIQDGKVVVQNVQDRQNRGHGNNARGAGGQDNAVDEDADEQPVQDLALNMDNVFQANDYDAFDYDVDDCEAGLSYDLDILSEVHDHDHYQDDVCKHHEVHEMHEDVQPNYVVDSHADYTSDSNMILYDQYVKDHAVPVIQSNVSSVPNDAYMMILNDMHEQPAQHVSVTTHNNVVDKSLTAELATYKKHVELKHDEIERKNLLIANDNLIADCMSKDVFYTATDYVLTVSSFSDMHEALNAAQKCIAELESENTNLQNKIQNDDHDAPIRDQPLPTDTSPTVLSPGYIANSNMKEDEEDHEEDPADHPVDGGDNDGNESSDDDDDDDDVEKDEDDEEEEEYLALANHSTILIDDLIPLS